MDNDVKTVVEGQENNTVKDVDQVDNLVGQESNNEDELYIAAKHALEENQSLKSTLENINKELAELKEKAAKLEEEKESLQLKLSASQETFDEMTAKYIESQASILSILKIASGNAQVGDLDNLLAKYKEKTIEYLSDAIVDALDEFKNKMTSVSKIDNPVNNVSTAESVKTFANKWEFEEFLSKELKKLF